MTQAPKPMSSHIPVALFCFILLVLGLSEWLPEFGNYYWIGLCVIFATIFAVTATMTQDASRTGKHLLHWLGAALALLVIFIFEYGDVINNRQATLFNIVVLGLVAYADGLGIHVRLALLGIFMLGLAVVMAIVSEYLWLFLGLSAMVVALQWYWSHRTTGSHDQNRPAAKTKDEGGKDGPLTPAGLQEPQPTSIEEHKDV